jgi:fimbrial chaperone protein
MQSSNGFLALACACLCWFFCSSALAGGIKVSPVTLTLSPAASSSTFVLTNQGTELVRFHITAFAWGEQPDGQMSLTPTTEIVFFPAMVSLKPGEARKVRVGVNVKPAALERSYRVFVQELPELVKTTGQRVSVVGMLTKMGIPVFYEASTRTAAPAITGLAMTGHSVKFNLSNRGTAHYRATKIVISAKDGSSVIQTVEAKGWYILAGGSRPYVVELPQAVCATLKSVQVDLESDKGAAKAVLANARCGP